MSDEPRMKKMFNDPTALIPLRGRNGAIRAHAIVDAADEAWVNQWRWFLGSKRYPRRIFRDSEGKLRFVLLHRELLGLRYGDGLEGDHINRDTLDNRRANLRVATRAQNGQNTSSRPGSSSKFRGVSWVKGRGKWAASIQMMDKSLNLGNFDDEAEAAAVARAARIKMMPYSVETI